MVAIRLAHKKRFTTVSNKLAQDTEISLKAKGLMVYLLSLPDDWIVYVDHLAKTLKEGKSAILSALKELKGFGYVHLTKKGFKEGWEYFIFEEPTSREEFKLFLRTNRFPNNSKTEQFENQQLQSPKEPYIQKKDLPTPKSAGGKVKLINVKERVNLTQKQYDELIKDYGKEAFEWIIEKLNTHKINKNQEYSSDFRAIKRWVIGAWKNETNRENANKEILEKNLKALKDIQENMERKQKRGLLIMDTDQARDTVLGKSCSLYNVNMPDIVAKWYGWNWRN